MHGDRPKGVVKTNSLTANTILVSMDREARVRALLKECSNLEQVLAREVSCAPAGEAVLPAGSSEECCNCTLGLLLHDNAIRSIMEGGPAFSSQLLDQGDVILEVDGHDATPGRLPELLIGCDVPGSFVTITVQKGGSGENRNVRLRRMSRVDAADSVKMFELFVRLKEAASTREDATRVVDDCMQHWTNMLRANAVREDTMAANAVAMRREGGVCIESLRQGLNRLLSFPVDMGPQDLAKSDTARVFDQKDRLELAFRVNDLQSRNEVAASTMRWLQEALNQLRNDMAVLSGEYCDLLAETEELRSALNESRKFRREVVQSEQTDKGDISHFQPAEETTLLKLAARTTDMPDQTLAVKSDLSKSEMCAITEDIESHLQECYKMCVELEHGLWKDKLDVPARTVTSPTARGTSEFRSTIGLLIEGVTISNIMVGGPAYRCKHFDKGDTILQVDGRHVSEESAARALIGCDVPGSVVTITVLKGVSGEIRDISLRRMARADMADLVQMFELFTRFQFLFFDEDSLLSARGAESFKCFEDCICHFTHILNTSALHDETMFTNVPVIQKNAGVCIESLRRALDQAVASAANISAGLEMNNMISRKRCMWAVARMQKNRIMRAFYLFACSLRQTKATRALLRKVISDLRLKQLSTAMGVWMEQSERVRRDRSNASIAETKASLERELSAIKGQYMAIKNTAAQKLNEYNQEVHRVRVKAESQIKLQKRHSFEQALHVKRLVQKQRAVMFSSFHDRVMDLKIRRENISKTTRRVALAVAFDSFVDACDNMKASQQRCLFKTSHYMSVRLMKAGLRRAFRIFSQRARIQRHLILISHFLLRRRCRFDIGQAFHSWIRHKDEKKSRAIRVEKRLEKQNVRQAVAVMARWNKWTRTMHTIRSAEVRDVWERLLLRRVNLWYQILPQVHAFQAVVWHKWKTVLCRSKRRVLAVHRVVRRWQRHSICFGWEAWYAQHVQTVGTATLLERIVLRRAQGAISFAWWTWYEEYATAKAHVLKQVNLLCRWQAIKYARMLRQWRVATMEKRNLHLAASRLATSCTQKSLSLAWDRWREQKGWRRRTRKIKRRAALKTSLTAFMMWESKVGWVRQTRAIGDKVQRLRRNKIVWEAWAMWYHRHVQRVRVENLNRRMLRRWAMAGTRWGFGRWIRQTMERKRYVLAAMKMVTRRERLLVVLAFVNWIEQCRGQRWVRLNVTKFIRRRKDLALGRANARWTERVRKAQRIFIATENAVLHSRDIARSSFFFAWKKIAIRLKGFHSKAAKVDTRRQRFALMKSMFGWSEYVAGKKIFCLKADKIALRWRHLAISSAISRWIRYVGGKQWLYRSEVELAHRLMNGSLCDIFGRWHFRCVVCRHQRLSLDKFISKTQKQVVFRSFMIWDKAAREELLLRRLSKKIVHRRLKAGLTQALIAMHENSQKRRENELICNRVLYRYLDSTRTTALNCWKGYAKFQQKSGKVLANRRNRWSSEKRLMIWMSWWLAVQRRRMARKAILRWVARSITSTFNAWFVAVKSARRIRHIAGSWGIQLETAQQRKRGAESVSEQQHHPLLPVRSAKYRNQVVLLRAFSEWRNDTSCHRRLKITDRLLQRSKASCIRFVVSAWRGCARRGRLQNGQVPTILARQFLHRCSKIIRRWMNWARVQHKGRRIVSGMLLRRNYESCASTIAAWIQRTDQSRRWKIIDIKFSTRSKKFRIFVTIVRWISFTHEAGRLRAVVARFLAGCQYRIIWFAFSGWVKVMSDQTLRKCMMDWGVPTSGQPLQLPRIRSRSHSAKQIQDQLGKVDRIFDLFLIRWQNKRVAFVIRFWSTLAMVRHLRLNVLKFSESKAMTQNRKQAKVGIWKAWNDEICHNRAVRQALSRFVQKRRRLVLKFWRRLLCSDQKGLDDFMASSFHDRISPPKQVHSVSVPSANEMESPSPPEEEKEQRDGAIISDGQAEKQSIEPCIELAELIFHAETALSCLQHLYQQLAYERQRRMLHANRVVIRMIQQTLAKYFFNWKIVVKLTTILISNGIDQDQGRVILMDSMTLQRRKQWKVIEDVLCRRWQRHLIRTSWEYWCRKKCKSEGLGFLLLRSERSLLSTALCAFKNMLNQVCGLRVCRFFLEWKRLRIFLHRMNSWKVLSKWSEIIARRRLQGIAANMRQPLTNLTMHLALWSTHVRDRKKIQAIVSKYLACATLTLSKKERLDLAWNTWYEHHVLKMRLDIKVCRIRMRCRFLRALHAFMSWVQQTSEHLSLTSRGRKMIKICHSRIMLDVCKWLRHLVWQERVGRRGFDRVQRQRMTTCWEQWNRLLVSNKRKKSALGALRLSMRFDRDRVFAVFCEWMRLATSQRHLSTLEDMIVSRCRHNMINSAIVEWSQRVFGKYDQSPRTELVRRVFQTFRSHVYRFIRLKHKGKAMEVKRSTTLARTCLRIWHQQMTRIKLELLQEYKLLSKQAMKQRNEKCRLVVHKDKLLKMLEQTVLGLGGQVQTLYGELACKTSAHPPADDNNQNQQHRMQALDSTLESPIQKFSRELDGHIKTCRVDQMSRRIMQRWSGKATRDSWENWYKEYSTQKILDIISCKIRTRRLFSQVRQTFFTWESQANKQHGLRARETHQRQIVMKIMKRIKHRALASALKLWCGVSTSSIRKQKIMEKILLLMSNRALSLALDLWCQWVHLLRGHRAESKRNRHVAEEQRRWYDVQRWNKLSDGFARWCINFLRCKLEAARVNQMNDLQKFQTSVICWYTWRTRTAEQVKTRQVFHRIICTSVEKLKIRCMRLALRIWNVHLDQTRVQGKKKSSQSRLIQWSTLAWTNKRVRLAWWAWSCSVQHAHRAHEQLRKVTLLTKLWRRRRLWRTFFAWSKLVFLLHRNYLLMGRFVMYTSSRSCFRLLTKTLLCWFHMAQELKAGDIAEARRQTIMSMTIRRMICRALSTVFQRWLKIAKEFRMTVANLDKILTSRTHRSVDVHLYAWHAFCQEKIGKRELIGKFLKRLMLRGIMRAWILLVIRIAGCEEVAMNHMARRRTHASLALVLLGWRRLLECQRVLFTASNRVSRRRKRLTIRLALSRWVFFNQLQRNRSKISSRWRRGMLFGSLYAWVDFVKTQALNMDRIDISHTPERDQNPSCKNSAIVDVLSLGSPANILNTLSHFHAGTPSFVPCSDSPIVTPTQAIEYSSRKRTEPVTEFSSRKVRDRGTPQSDLLASQSDVDISLESSLPDQIAAESLDCCNGFSAVRGQVPTGSRTTNPENVNSVFRNKSSLGIFIRCNHDSEASIDGMAVGGPAYNCEELMQGDVLLMVDDEPVDADNCHDKLVGSDAHGSTVKLKVRCVARQQIKDVLLRRMSHLRMRNNLRMFEIFTSLKDHAFGSRDEVAIRFVDEGLELFTSLLRDNDNDLNGVSYNRVHSNQV